LLAKKIRGLLLAGGAATRFGSAKLLHPFEAGLCIGEASARNLIAGVGSALAVVRPGDETLASRLRAAGCDVLVTERALGGLGASIAAGVAATRDSDGWIVALADMPRVSSVISAAVAESIARGALIAAPVFAPTGERGHPVGFSAFLLGELLALTGDQGAKAILKRRAGEWEALPVDDAGVLFDVDHPHDLIPKEVRESGI